jgi:hypothetical protein
VFKAYTIYFTYFSIFVCFIFGIKDWGLDKSYGNLYLDGFLKLCLVRRVQNFVAFKMNVFHDYVHCTLLIHFVCYLLWKRSIKKMGVNQCCGPESASNWKVETPYLHQSEKPDPEVKIPNRDLNQREYGGPRGSRGDSSWSRWGSSWSWAETRHGAVEIRRWSSLWVSPWGR